ncbi:MAG: hypothetical protein RJQ04_09740 [Longimicrobiales bacterium]
MVQPQVQDLGDAQATALLALLVVVPVAAYTARWSLRRHLRRLMATASGSPTGTDDPVGQDTAPSAALRFTTLDAGVGHPDAVAAREALARRARARLRTAFLVELAATAGYLILLMGILGDMGVLLLSFNGAAYLVYVAFRYFRNRGQLHAVDTRSRAVRWAETAVAILVGLVTLGRIRLSQSLAARADRQHHLRPAWQALQTLLLPLLAGVIGSVLALTGTPAGLGLVAFAALHAGVLWLLRSRADRHPGVGVLVLRVFDVDANARFTFGGLLAFWHHLGPFFTVVDSSFWKHGNRADSWGQALALVGLAAWGLTVSILSSEFGAVPEDVAPWVGIPAVLAAVAVWVWTARRLMGRQFIGSADQLARRLRRLDRHPFSLALTYRALPTMCRDDTWRSTVRTLTTRADVVLMDLRGFSDARKGCAWEVEYLLDVKPLDRILFLVDRDTDPGPVHRLLEASWQRLDGASPNLAQAAPEARLYHAGVQDDADVQGILDALVGAAAAGQPA